MDEGNSGVHGGFLSHESLSMARSWSGPDMIVDSCGTGDGMVILDNDASGHCIHSR